MNSLNHYQDAEIALATIIFQGMNPNSYAKSVVKNTTLLNMMIIIPVNLIKALKIPIPPITIPTNILIESI